LTLILPFDLLALCLVNSEVNLAACGRSKSIPSKPVTLETIKSYKHTMKLYSIAAIAVACLLLAGCEACPHYNRTQVVGPNGMAVTPLPKKAYGSVKLYQDKSEVKGQYEVIGLLSVAGDAGDEPRFITAFLYRAADIGADGVIFTRGTQQAVASMGPWGTMNTSVQAVFRGEAIKLK
jgi:hypothetical protein